MRIRRPAIVLGTAAVFAVGVIAYATSAAAIPPACNPGPSGGTDNKSCMNFQFLPSNPHGVQTAGTLFVHTHTNYASPGNKAAGGFAKTVTIYFDTDFGVNFGTIPKCGDASVAGKNIRDAWKACGPGAVASKNAYLSPQTAVSGQASTAPLAGGQGNFGGCTLVFRGNKNAADVLLYTRVATLPNSTPSCGTPASNTFGNQTILLHGTIGPANLAGFGKKLTVGSVDAVPLPLDDFYASLKRGTFVTAKCSATPWKNRATFAYSGGPPSPQPTDTSNASQACS